MELLEEMQRRGVEPAVITWSAAISACEQGGDVDADTGANPAMAAALFREAQARSVYATLWKGSATVDLHGAIVGKCGAPPQKECLGEQGGGCPHYSSDGYDWIAREVLAPAFRAALQ